MEAFVSQQAFKKLVGSVFEPAPKFGYHKSGQMIKKMAYGNASIVEFQKSRDSTKENVRFTLNLAIVCGEMLKIDGLMYPFGTTLQSANAHTSHLKLRIGQVVYGQDRWWDLNESTNIEDILVQLRYAIYEKSIPYIEKFLKNEDLLKLWVSNGYHGLTPGLRDQYVDALSKIVKCAS
jgi:hypothetical protein